MRVVKGLTGAASQLRNLICLFIFSFIYLFLYYLFIYSVCLFVYLCITFCSILMVFLLLSIIWLIMGENVRQNTSLQVIQTHLLDLLSLRYETVTKSSYNSHNIYVDSYYSVLHSGKFYFSRKKSLPIEYSRSLDHCFTSRSKNQVRLFYYSKDD